jgi:hypothetical protein
MGLDAEDAQTPISEVYYIVPGKCTECKVLMNHNVLQYVL